MKDLLDTLDVLSGDGATRESRTTAARYPKECRTTAQNSAARLRKHLAYAEELTELLITPSDGAAGTRPAPGPA
jgi:hypothetical protein